jgi:hypothetical protein
MINFNNQFLKKSFSKLILVDVRDTVFQSDPFQLIDDSKDMFYAIGENPKDNIKSCGKLFYLIMLLI